MKEKTKGLFNYLINLSFIIYFVILIIERGISVGLTISSKGFSYLFSEGFNSFTYSLVFVSIIGFIVYCLFFCRDSFKLLFHPKKRNELVVNYQKLSIASGILLLGGMVFTDNTLAGLQFASYGVLIVGLLLKVIEYSYESKNKVSLWISFAYLVCFSMSIPVMHNQVGLCPSYVAYHGLSGTAVIVLVMCFTFLEAKLFSDKYDNLFNYSPILITIGFNLVLACWPQLDSKSINWFAIIFMIASFVLFVFGFIYNWLKKVKQEQ